MKSSHWKILACDLDGTLIGWNHTINDRDLAALRDARDAGIHVAICTGRNAFESAGIIRSLALTGPGVFVNGATVADMATGRALACRFMQPSLIDKAIDFFGSRGHAVLLLGDHPDTRTPTYFLTTHAPPHRGTTEWLLANRISATAVDAIPVEFAHRIVRLGIVAPVADGRAMEAQMDARFGAIASHHSIYSPHYDCQVLEVFSPDTNKWTGLLQLSAALAIHPQHIIAIGDDTNDIAMLQGAALSFVMGNARDDIKPHAKKITASHQECGVAQVIESLLRGELEPK